MTLWSNNTLLDFLCFPFPMLAVSGFSEKLFGAQFSIGWSSISWATGMLMNLINDQLWMSRKKEDGCSVYLVPFFIPQLAPSDQPRC